MSEVLLGVCLGLLGPSFVYITHLRRSQVAVTAPAPTPASVPLPAIPAEAVALLADTPLITDAQSILRHEQAAKLRAIRDKRIVGLPENYSGPITPIAL